MSNTPRTDKLEREIATGDWPDATVIMNLIFTMREWEGAISVFVNDPTTAHAANNLRRLKEIGTCPTCKGHRIMPRSDSYQTGEGDPCPDCVL